MPALRIVMMGATGEVGQHVVRHLQTAHQFELLTLLGRRAPNISVDTPAMHHANSVAQVHSHVVDVLNPQSYTQHLGSHTAAVCTLGVGQPSKLSLEEFVRLDRDAVFNFASACRAAGVRHFSLLGSIASDEQSRSAYLRTKGQLVKSLIDLKFERLSVFQPSMILTPSNRYGFTQAVALVVWPLLQPLLQGRWRRYRGVSSALLGQAMANNLSQGGMGVQLLEWDAIMDLATCK
jgi:uncharacterized protein YbjT (DUF2867 family)